MTTEQPQILDYEVEPPFRAFSTMREGGVSKGAYASLNVNGYCGDEPTSVDENRRRLAAYLGLQGDDSVIINMGVATHRRGRATDDRLVLPHQVHGTRLEALTADYLTLSTAERTAILEGVDGVMTDMAGLCVGVSTADCIPVLLYDTEHRAVCAVHAGWRGTVQRIVRHAVEAMTVHYQSRPEALHAIVGPGISLESFEVGNEVYAAFADAHFPMSRLARRFPVILRGGGLQAADEQAGIANLSSEQAAMPTKWHIDLPAANVETLLAAGLDLTNIRVSGICTYQHPDRFFSARRLGIHSGRIYTGIFVK